MGKRLDNAKRLYLEAIGDGNYAEAIDTYAGERYTQHSTPVRDGKAGFIEFFAQFVERNPERDIDIVRSFEDGRYVFLHVVQTLNGGQHRYVTADIFDTDDRARMVEHWDIIQEWADETVSDHTQVDGPTEPTDLDRTEENKALVTGYVTDVLSDGELEKAPLYVSTETYLEHSPERPDGIDALVELVGRPDRPVVYEEIHRVVGSGSLVAVLAKVRRVDIELAVGLTRDAGWQIGVSRTLPIDLEAAWAYLLSPDGLATWLGPGIDGPLTGGQPYRTADGIEGEVRSLRDHDRVRLTWQPTGRPSPATVQIALTPTRTGTTFRFHAEHLSSPEERELMREHWRRVAARFEADLAG